MQLKATVVKAELQLSDLDRHHYATYPLTLAQHPSETDQRLMARLVAFALFADERLEFGKGLSNEEEPDLWRRDYTGEIEQWIDLGQPDESRIRKASGRARQVIVVNYGGRVADLWWDKNAAALARLGNLTVIDLDAVSIDALTAMIERSMRFNAILQDGELQLMGDAGTWSRLALPAPHGATRLASPVNLPPLLALQHVRRMAPSCGQVAGHASEQGTGGGWWRCWRAVRCVAAVSPRRGPGQRLSSSLFLEREHVAIQRSSWKPARARPRSPTRTCCTPGPKAGRTTSMRQRCERQDRGEVRPAA
jgi:uncharacterized protein YaeQ